MNYQNQPAIDIGDFAPDFVLRDERGNPVFSRGPYFACRFTLLLFVPDPDAPDQAALLSDIGARAAKMKRDDLAILAVTRKAPPENRQLKAARKAPFRFLSDNGGKTLAAYGVVGDPRAVLVNSNARIIAFPLPQAVLDTALAEIDRPAHRPEATVVTAHAPVLLIPNVLSADDCAALIDLYERDNYETGVATEASGVGAQEIDHSFKHRRDHQIADPDMIARVNNRLARRIVPEIKKAFNYEVTRFEHLRIGCYDAGAGFFRAHRDNTKPATAHRKFALTLCLNDGYEGGHLRFPEYGGALYRPAAGGAVVFACSLLHEVVDVTQGRRFSLITFFFGEAEYHERKARYEQARKTAEAKG